MMSTAKPTSPGNFSLFPQNKRAHYPGLPQYHQVPRTPPPPPQQQNQPPQYPKQFEQELYSSHLYASELSMHEQVVSEYDMDVYEAMIEQMEQNKPNVNLYKQQPYLTPVVRVKLVEFLLKMSVRLKILPFVFYKAVRLFDRYCCKRIVLLDQSQLIITTCLWIASKVNGGNNHFVNMNNLNKCVDGFRVIGDLGYGSGGKYIGPTERFRLPKLHELVKLCGAKCKYDMGMFKQMELHILSTLDWNLCDPSIEEFIIKSNEFSTFQAPGSNDGQISTAELFKVKEYLSYISLYSFDLVDTSLLEVGQVISDLINDVFQIDFNSNEYQIVQVPSTLSSRLSYPLSRIDIEMSQYKIIKKSLIKAILNTSEYMLNLFNTSGPRYLYRAVVNGWTPICNVPPAAARICPDYTPVRSASYPSTDSFSTPSPTGSAYSTTTPTCMSTVVTPPTPYVQMQANKKVVNDMSTPPGSKMNNYVHAPPHAVMADHHLPLPQMVQQQQQQQQQQLNHTKSTPVLRHYDSQSQQQQPLRVNTNLPPVQNGSFFSSSYPSAISSAASSASTVTSNVFDKPMFTHNANASASALSMVEGGGSCMSRSSTPMSDIDATATAAVLGANKSPGSIYMAMERMRT